MSTERSKLLKILEDERWERVRRILEDRKRWALAFSGGKDSTVLLWFAAGFTSSEIIPVFFDHDLLPSSERKRPAAVLKALNMPLQLGIVPFNVLEISEVYRNPRDRCYHCKRGLMERLTIIARGYGCDGLCDGTVADDEKSFRPGIKALREYKVVSPLAEAGIRTEDVLKVITHVLDLPEELVRPESCMATRVPYETELDRDLLYRLDRLEGFLKGVCRGPVRARYHPVDNMVRLELDPGDLAILMEGDYRAEVSDLAGRLGFRFVTIDLAGFRSGSWDSEFGDKS